MKRSLFLFLTLLLLLGQILLITGYQPSWAQSTSVDQASGTDALVFLPPTARPSLTPSLTPITPAPTQPPPGGGGPAPTQPPVVTPTPTPPIAVVNVSSLNVRQGPGLIYNVLGTAQSEERYLVLGQNLSGDWLQIDFNGRKGWVFRSLVILQGDTSRIPIITEIPPTPTFTPSPTATYTPTPTATFTPQPTAPGETPTPTQPPPTSTPTATPAPPMAVVREPTATIQSGPGVVYDPLGEAQKGDVFLITGISPSGDWLQIDFQGQPGWIFKELVEPIPPTVNIPVVEEIPPTPTYTPKPPTPTPPSQPTPTIVSAPAGSGPSSSQGPPTLLLILIGLVVIVIILGLIYYFLRGGSKPPS